MSIRSAAGAFGKPGMVIMSPAMATMKPAPLAKRTSLISTLCPVGAPLALGLVENEIWVFAMQIGKWPYLVCKALMSDTTFGLALTLAAPYSLVAMASIFCHSGSSAS